MTNERMAMTAKATVEEGDASYPGQAVYSAGALRLYNLLTFDYNLPFLWRCPKRRLLALYDEHVSARHLDVGVGTGYLLERCEFPSSTPEIALMDLNPNPLEHAARRLSRYQPSVHQADVLASWPLAPCSFDSVAMVNLLHCLPGNMRGKSLIFEQANEALTPGGTLFGATVLGEGVELSRRARRRMEKFNRSGIFSNLEDNLEDLCAGLDRVFGSSAVEMQGAVALFAAHKPKTSDKGASEEYGA
jgi:SAM-dependent methyltransferase